MNKSFLSTKRITVIAIMSAIAGVLMVLDFPITFIAPSFYKLDISDLPCLICTFSLGPLSGAITELAKILIKILIKPTSTMFVGELSNFLCGVSFIIPAGIIYKNNHTKNGAIQSLLAGSVCFVIAGFVINYFITIPFFVSLFNISLDTIIKMGSDIFPVINSKFMLVLICVSLFNVLKAVLVSVLSYLSYKRISPLLKDSKEIKN